MLALHHLILKSEDLPTRNFMPIVIKLLLLLFFFRSTTLNKWLDRYNVGSLFLASHTILSLLVVEQVLLLAPQELLLT